MRTAALFIVAFTALCVLVMGQAPQPPIQEGSGFTETRCNPGTCIRRNDAKTCIPCVAGTWQNGWGVQCNQISGYSYTTISNKVYGHCEPASVNYWTPENSSKQYKCPAGTYSPANSDKCIQCNAGFVSKKAGSSCEACPEGTYQNAAGQSSCKKCPKGSTSAADRGQCLWSTGSSATAKKAAAPKAPVAKALLELQSPEPLPIIVPGKAFEPAL